MTDTESEMETSTPTATTTVTHTQRTMPETTKNETDLPLTRPSSREPPTNSTPVLFSPIPMPSTSTTPDPVTPQEASDKQAGTSHKKFLEALKAHGPAQRALIHGFKPADHYYKAQALWLQHKYGDYNKANKTNNKEQVEWKKLVGCIRQNVFTANALACWTFVTICFIP